MGEILYQKEECHYSIQRKDVGRWMGWIGPNPSYEKAKAELINARKVKPEVSFRMVCVKLIRMEFVCDE